MKNILKEIEKICKEKKIMEKHYGLDKFDESEPYFTSSQEMDIKELINENLSLEEIISNIEQW